MDKNGSEKLSTIESIEIVRNFPFVPETTRMGRSARTVFTIVLSFRREVSHDAGNAGSRAHSRSDPLRDRLAVSRHIRAETEDGSQIQCQGQLRGINHRSTAAQGSSRGSR